MVETFSNILNMRQEIMSGKDIKQIANNEKIRFIYVVCNGGWIRNIYQPFNELNDNQTYKVFQSTTPQSLMFPFSKRITIDLE